MMSGSETGIMSAGRESYGILPKNPVHTQQQSGTPSMRLTFSSDGTAVYKPLNQTYQQPTTGGGGGGGGGGSGGGAGGGGGPPPPPAAPHSAPPPGVGVGGSGENSSGNMIQHGGISMSMGSGEPMKRKRGRPRKYGPDGTMALALTTVSTAPAPGAVQASGFSASSGPQSPSSMKKARGRPPGSGGKKQQMAALGSAGVGFTPHVITVKAGEDVSAKIMAFSQNGPRAICILSANGAISNVTLRQAATSGGTVTYEGRFEILSLSGSFLLSESGGQRSRTGGLSVSLAGPDGRVLGGGVAGLLTAASPVQVVVGSFIADGRKESKPKQNHHAEAASAPSRLAPCSGMGGTSGMLGGASSPPSRGTMSESSGGPGSPLNQSSGACNNNNNNAQGMPNMPWK